MKNCKLYILIIFIFCLFNNQLFADNIKIILSVLAPQNMIDNDIFTEFENQTKINLRVEFVQSLNEYEVRLKGAMGAWDIVIANEKIIYKLINNKMIKAFNYFDSFKLEALNEKNIYNPEGLFYLPLAVNKLGLAWLKNTKTSKNKINWDNLANLSENPLWRSKIFLPKNYSLLLKLSMLNINQNIYTLTNKTENIEQQQLINEDSIDINIINWLKKIMVQNRHNEISVLHGFLSTRISVALLWQNEYKILKKYINNLEFDSPVKTFYERFMASVIINSSKIKYTDLFIQFLYKNRNKYAEFLELHSIDYFNIENNKKNLYNYTLTSVLIKNYEEKIKKMLE